MLILDFPNAPCPIGQSAIVPRCVLATKCSSTELRTDDGKFRKKNVIFQAFNNISYQMWRKRTANFSIQPTCQLVNSPTRLPSTFCPLFSTNFNIMSAFLSTKSPTRPQKIDSREGLFWCKRGVACDAGKMNFYLEQPSFTPILGLFSAKYSAIWC